MKHSSGSNYNIYNTRRKNSNSRRRNFVIVCLFLCMICVILDIIFVSKLLGKDKKKLKNPSDSSSEVLTDDSGNVIDPSADPSANESDSSTTTAPLVQTVDAETRAANLAQLNTDISEYLGKQSGRYSVYYINMKEMRS